MLECARFDQVADLLPIGSRHRCQRIVRQQNLVGFLLADVEHQDWHHCLGRSLCPEMPVDQLQLSLVVFANQQRIGVTDVCQHSA